MMTFMIRFELWCVSVCMFVRVSVCVCDDVMCPILFDVNYLIKYVM